MSQFFTRRQFIHLLGAGTAVSGAVSPRLFGAEPENLYLQVVPTRKGLAHDWITALVRRDHSLDAPIRGDKSAGTLDRIGMTVGGIACGTVYLGGDGRLFVWDIFNQRHEGVVAQKVTVPAGLENLAGAGTKVRERDGANYLNPPTPDTHPNGFVQDFALRCAGRTIPFAQSGWAEVEFDGRWPVGSVSYRDPGLPLEARLDAWSPFIPGQLDDSSLPVTVMEFTLRNPGREAVSAAVVGRLGNAVCLHSITAAPVERRSEVRRENSATLLIHRAGNSPVAAHPRPDIPFADFERDDYGDWQIEGEAFGTGPVAIRDIPVYQGAVGGAGERVVNSHASAPGADIAVKDRATGNLTSPEFEITRRFIHLRLGGGAHPGKTCVDLLVDGKPVRSVTGSNDNRMRQTTIPCDGLEGRRARLRIVDAESGAWGNIGVDEIVFSDAPPAGEAIEERPDFGTMTLAALGEADCDGVERVTMPVTVPAGGKTTVRFILAWHFPNLHPLPKLPRQRRHYAIRFADAAAIATHVAGEFERLAQGTKAWVATWYDSSLPRWLLHRAAATSNTLQTANCLMFEDGRFWAWEGIGCCPGTCAHVWHYAQGPARLFPAIERNLREVTDYGVAQNADGSVRFRAESGGVAVDAQTGLILRTWREHLCSTDKAFLARVWPGAKRAVQWLIEFDRRDPDGLDGLLHGEQHNTLDAEWYGKVHALCSLYLAALRAGEAMAREMGDTAFAAECARVFASGTEKIARLFNGEFYEQEEDPQHLDKIGVGKGCYIDQVIGQWWANQTGLGPIANRDHIQSALHSLWRYNFLPDVGPFRRAFPRGRFYAVPGDAGLIMCSWPKGGLRPDFKRHWQYGYFNECMTGFEWQAAAHMIQEGAPVSRDGFEDALENPSDPRSLTLRGLAVARAIHDRYAPAKRNPYNEIECSDHYARAAASWSVLLAVCGFQYDGPAGILGFAPKLQPENFRAPFTAAEGWGTFQQSQRDGKWTATLRVTHGRLRLNSVRLPWLTTSARVRHQGTPVPATGASGTIAFGNAVIIAAGEELTIE